MNIVEDELRNNQDTTTILTDTDFLNAINSNNLIDSLMNQIEDDDLLSDIDYLTELKDSIDDYKERFKFDIELLDHANKYEFSLYIKIIGKLLLDKYDFSDDVIENNFDLPNITKQLLFNSYYLFVLKRKELIINYLFNSITNNFNQLANEAKSEIEKDIIDLFFKRSSINLYDAAAIMCNLDNIIKDLVHEPLNQLDDSSLDLIIKSKEDTYEFEFVQNFLSDVADNNLITIFCNPIIKDTILKEELKTELKIKLYEHFTEESNKE